MAKNTIAFFTLGCRLNQSETAVLERVCALEGYTVTDVYANADIVVINTCTVTQKGDADTRKIINKVIRQNPHVQIALIGCQAQIQKEKLKDWPNVHWVIGTASKMDLARLLKEGKRSRRTRVIVSPIDPGNFTVPTAGMDEQHTRANLKIQDGCDFFCAYCEIPYARGRARSRKFNDILKEANILAGSGHQEIILTGINLGLYREGGKTLYDVILALSDIPDLKRIRISSIEFTTIPEPLVPFLSRKSKLCRHLHIPLQSASDTILQSMNRKYIFKDYEKFIRLLRENVLDLCLGTDIMVGFPGETEKYFEETRQRLEQLPVDYFHVFSYSERKMARSRSLPERVPVQTIAQRSRILRELGAAKRKKFYADFKGKDVEVLCEQKKGEYWSGLTENYARVFVDSRQSLQNEFVPVSIVETGEDKLFGRISKPFSAEKKMGSKA